MRNKLTRIGIVTVCFLVPILCNLTLAATTATTGSQPQSSAIEPIPSWIQTLAKRTNMPWYDIAAIHQYEYDLHHKRNEAPNQSHFLIPAKLWSGLLNPNDAEQQVGINQLYGGIGRDGDGDGKAQLGDREDVTYSIFRYFSKYGVDDSHLQRTLLHYYGKPDIVKRIFEFKTIYQTCGTTKLNAYDFPLPVRRDYSYRDTWGDPRGWGGRRIHEGTDIFAPYGTPVKAVTFAFVESKGWNKYGGWRVGLRTVDNVYVYYAHLSGFAKGLKEGMVVKPGDVVGYVGSSGYGRVGTSGKFPPHLHFGLYRATDKHEWAFDPYPSLKRWERLAKKAAKK